MEPVRYGLRMILAAATLLLSSSSAPHLVQPWAPDSTVGQALAATDLTAAAATTQLLLNGTPREYPARGLLPLVKLAFAQPWALPEIAHLPAARAAAQQSPWRAAAVFAATALGADCEPSVFTSPGQGTMTASDPQRAVYALDFVLNEANHIVKEALAQCPPEDIAPERVLALLDGALGSTARDTPRAQALSLALAASTNVDRARLVAAVAHLDVALDTAADWSQFEAEGLPDELAGAVQGKVLTAQPVPELGWVVVGSMEANRYDMSRIAAVFDPGGDDTYEWHGTVAGSRLVVDLAGNDTYTADGLGGPGGAVLGASIVSDLAGDDRYTGSAVALGAGVFGVGVLVDWAGNDTYTAARWSVGAAIAGVGALVDLGGTDLYDAPLFCQGVGGPCGAGLLLDRAGDDRYRADRGTPSVYGTPATYVAFSQGCAFGYRAGIGPSRGAAGGVGALVDVAGDDRYECGEFGQGCGYYLGMGILHDGSGNDLYVGNRYAQGTAAHQAFGALEDAAGNDIYHGVTAANQGAAWDMSAAVLLDRAGDDTYRGGTLSQGAAAQQALGMLLDLGGTDRYEAGAASQGAADGNQYHWDTTHTPSFALFWHAGGLGTISSGRVPGPPQRTGTDQGEAGKDGRTQWGLVILR